MSALLNPLTLSQDYLWFLAALGWLVVGILWNQSRDPAWSWVGATSAAGLLAAVTEIAMLVRPVHPSPAHAAHLTGELVLVALAWLQLWGWAWPSLGTARARVLALGLVPLVLYYHRWLPREAGLFLLGFAALLALHRLRRLPAGSRVLPGIALVLVVGTIAFSTHGPVAVALGQSRRWMEVSQMGLVAVSIQLLAIAVILRILGRRTVESWPAASRDDRRRDLRWCVRSAALWCLLGLGLAGWNSSSAREAFERSVVTRIQLLAGSLDSTALALALGEGFRIVPLGTSRQPSGMATGFGRVPYQTGPECAPVRRAIATLAARNRDFRWLAVRTFRDGRVILCLNNYPPDRVTFEGTISSRDELDWQLPASGFRTLNFTAYGEISEARAPLFDPSGRMLGWLVGDVGLSAWLAPQAKARIQAFLVTGLGLAVLFSACVQRWRERERLAARRDATLAQSKERIKDAFLAKVSHELRTPLQTVLGYGELARRAALDPTLQRQLDAILQHGGLLLRLVNDLLDLSAIEAGSLRISPRPVAVTSSLAATAESLRPLAEAKGLRFSVQTAGDAGWALADPARLGQILINLGGNAIKFTGKGEVRIEVACATGPAGDVAVSIAVRDTGPGIPPDLRDRIFKPFARLATTAHHPGAGLGLAITAGICAQLGGRIEIDDNAGIGTAFLVTLRLPCAPAVAVPPPDGTPLASGRLSGWSILVADDNELVRELFVAQLRSLGAGCIAAADGEAAVALALRTPFAAAVIDLSMPGLDGLEVARRIRAHQPAGTRLRLVAASAHSRSTDRSLAVAAGFDHYLVKPVSLGDLVHAIDPGHPVAPALPEPLLRRLHATFLAELPVRVAQLAAAVETTDWSACRTHAHYLRNSAAVVGDLELAAALAALELAAENADSVRLQESALAVRHAVARWLEAPYR